MGKAFAVAVEQHRAFASYRLGNQEALAVSLSRKRGGVELNAREVADLRAEHVGKGDAVAGRDSGVGCVLINPAYAAGGEQTVVAAEVKAFAVLENAQVKSAEGLVHGVKQRVVENIDVGQLLDLLDKRVYYRLAGGVLVVDNAVAAVTCLKGLAHGAVGIEVVIHAEVFGAQHVGGTLLDELLNRRKGVFVLAGDKSVVDMQLVVVVNGVEHAGNAALSEGGVGKRQLAF